MSDEDQQTPPENAETRITRMIRNAEEFLADTEMCYRFPQAAAGAKELLDAVTVRFEIHDGVPEITQLPIGIRVLVCDYDVEGADDDDRENGRIVRDAEGKEHYLSVFIGDTENWDDDKDVLDDESEEAVDEAENEEAAAPASSDPPVADTGVSEVKDRRRRGK